ncbi:MAG: two-component regulator propeller domain-containing protein [Thermoanaerobaculia bacterium]
MAWSNPGLKQPLTLLCCLCVLAALLVPSPGHGHASDGHDLRQALTQYRMDGWKTQQGLPMDTVQCLLQTRDGYLWIGTGGGLARFDGIRFVTFESAGVPHLTTRAIFGLMEDSQGRLWIGHSEGATVYRNGRFQNMFGSELTNGRRVWAFAEGADGTIWAATENGLVRWHDGATRVYRVEDGLPTNRLRSLAMARDGTLWLGSTGGGLVSFANERFAALTPATGFPHLEVRSVLADPAGGVWAATAGGGLARVDGGRITRWAEADGLPTSQLTSLSRDSRGSLWIGTWGAGLCRMQDGRFTSISTEGGLGGGQIWSVHADREDSIWVGTWVGGLNRLRDREFLVLGAPEGLSHDNVRSVLRARDGAMWVSTAGGGVNRIDDGAITTIRKRDGLPTEETSSLMEDRDGAIWIGTYTSGVVRIKNGRIDTWGKDEGLPHLGVRALMQDRTGAIWAGTMGGVARFDGRRFTPLSGGAPPEGATTMLETRDGTLWFGTTGDGLFRYRDGVFRSFTRKDGLVSNWVMSLHEDEAGSLWIGTNGEGLNRLRNGRITAIRPEDGLWDGVVQAIFEDRGGHLWMTCNRGVFRIARAELDAFAEGRAARVTSVVFGPGHSLRSTTFAGGHQPAGAFDAEGHLWLPTFSGLVIVDPARLPGSGQPPSVHLEEVFVSGVAQSPHENVTLPPGSVPLWIRYTSTTLYDADRVRFRYRMDGTPGGWVDVGRNREAFFPTLPHGSYRFRVAASTDGIRWREASTSLVIDVRPHFFQTRWFIGVAILSVLALPALIWHLRMRQFRARHVEMERLVAEKTEELRLANEHLARLSFVDSLTGLANRRRFDEALEEEWNRAMRFRSPIALLVADVDLFKNYNDALGHVEGDRCLTAVARVFLQAARRSGDLVARYGGEELVCLVPGADRTAALALAESLRSSVEALGIPHPASPVSRVVTISLGVAAIVPSIGTSSSSLVEEADASLYRAKREGRNRVAFAEDSGPA